MNCPLSQGNAGSSQVAWGLSQLIDLAEVQNLMQALYRATGINHALLDREGRVLTAVGWKKVCTDFHRVHPESCRRCLASDQYIFSHLNDGPYVGYECLNGLFDYATPVMIGGEHVANIFTGQMLHQPPDLDRFRRQAEEFGFAPAPYLAALREVSVTPRERMPDIMAFLVRLAQTLGTNGLIRLRQLEAEAELQKLNRQLTQRVEERTAELSEKNRLLRQNEERLQQSHDLLAKLSEQVPGVLFQYRLFPNGQACFPFANPAMREIYEVSPEAVRHDAAVATAFHHPDDVDGIVASQKKSARTLEPWHYEYRVILPRQGMRWRLGNARPEKLKDGSIVWHGFVTDITERKAAEAEQKRLDRTLRLLSDSNTALLQADDEACLLPDICRLVVEKGGYLLAWVGLAESDAEKSVRPAAHWGNDGGYLQDTRFSWGDGELGRGPTGTAIRTGKTQITQDALSAPRLAPWRAAAMRQGYRSGISLPLVGNRQVLGALVIYAAEPAAFAAEEVRLLEKLANNLAFGIAGLRARAQLAAANQKLQAFTYAASHDLKAPLRRINSFSELLERQYRDRLDGNGLLFLEHIRSSATRMTALVDDLLTYARMDHGSGGNEAVDLPAAVGAILAEQQEEIRQRGAELRLAVPAATVLADPCGLAQVLRNLLSNALKYSAPASPPVIEIGGEQENGRCRLWVRDNGIGFAMAEHERIFEIFRRLHTYAEYPGSGVGLALVKKAMERMGGRVWAESAPGEGAAFFLELPAARGPQPQGAAGGNAPVTPSAAPGGR